MMHRVFVHLPRVLALALLLLSAGSTARADVAVLVPPQADQAVGPEFLDEAVKELTRLLKVAGFDVISAGQAGPAAEAEQQRGAFSQEYDPLHCLTPECANEYRALFDATFAVQLTLVSRGIRPSSVSVVLTEGLRAFFKGNAPIEGHDIRSAVRTAFASARQKQEEGAGPWLTMQGSPEGALVYVDNAEYGRLPFSKRHIDPGQHQVEVRADGHGVERRSIDVPSRIDHVEVVSVALASLDPVADAVPASQRRLLRRTPWDWAIGGGIAAFSAAHLIAGLYQRGKAGDCARRPAGGPCLEYYGDTQGASRENVLIGVGLTGIVLGTAVMVLGPVARLQAHATRDSAMLRLRGEF